MNCSMAAALFKSPVRIQCHNIQRYKCVTRSCVPGLPHACTERELRDFFSTRYLSGGGEIEEVHMYDNKAIITFASNSSESTLNLSCLVAAKTRLDLISIHFFVAAVNVSERHRTSPLVLNGATLEVTHLRGGGRRDDLRADVDTMKKALFVKVQCKISSRGSFQS